MAVVGDMRFRGALKRPHGSNRLTSIAALLAIAIANAQDDKAALRIVVSIPGRKLALLEGERVLKVYDVAFGKPGRRAPRRIQDRLPRRQSSLEYGVDSYK